MWSTSKNARFAWRRIASRGALVLLIAATSAMPLAGIASASAGVVKAEESSAVKAALARQGHAAITVRGRSAGSVALGGSPALPAVNASTNSLYVPIQCTTRQCTSQTRAVDIINTAKCNARALAGCRVVAVARAGLMPLAAVVDQAADTVYVVNGGSNSLSVLNGARCNATVTSGCARPAATVSLRKSPVAAAFDPATRTVYVASPAGYLFVVDAAKCNAVTTRECGHAVSWVRIRQGPDAVDVDIASDTIYTANAGPTGAGDTVSVINGSACNGTNHTGCGRAPRLVTVGSNPLSVAVDQASGAVYVANYNAGTVSVIDGARCNARVSSGCRRTPPTVTTGASPAFVAVDAAVHTVFAINQDDDTISVINTRTCGGTVTTGCRRVPATLQAAPDHGAGYNPFPSAMALLPGDGTAYLLNVGGASLLSVTSIRGCNATTAAACRRPAPAVPDGEFLVSVDPATDTLYGGNLSSPEIDVINGATCRAGHLSGCRPVAEIPVPDPGPNIGAIDEATHTLYVGDPPSQDVFVVNTAACNATNTAGCSAALPSITIGPGPEVPVVDTATQTMYVTYGAETNKVAVVNAATCSAITQSGCGQTPATVTVGVGTVFLAVSQATDTIYGPSSGNGFSGHTVAVINGATCNGADHAGCARLAATIRVGKGPSGAAVDDRTHTLYVANNANGDTPGTVSVIDTATCNGTDTAGCAGRFPVMPAGASPIQIAVDVRTGAIYVTNFGSADVSVLNGARCNATTTRGCSAAPHQQAVGSQPIGAVVNPATGTVYVTNLFSATLSIFPAQ